MKNVCPGSRSAPGRDGRGFSPPEVVVEVKAIACQLPSELGLPLSRLHVPDIRQEVLRRGLVAEISGTTIWRWLSEDAIRPWAHRSWIFPRDPQFEAKAGQVLDLYAGSFDGKRLRRDEYVVSADEMPSIQALARCHPTQPPGPGRPMCVEHEYKRRGTLAYLAAWDVHRAKAFGCCDATTGIAPFARLVAQVMTQEPYASARRVFWVVDNGSSHNGWAAAARLRAAWPRAVLIHTPIHASWLNQVEIYLSIVKRKALTPRDFVDLVDAEDRLHRFERYYQASAAPFEWKFTRADLTALLRRLAAHQSLQPAA